MRELSIIILQHNTPEHVTRNLEALQKADLPPNTEIIVVNNGGKNANDKVPKEAYVNLDVKFFDTPNDGFPAGNNFGLKQTEARYYAFINPDIVVQPDTMVKLLDYLKRNPKVGIVSPQLRYRDGTVQDNYRVFPRILDLIIKRIPFLRKRFPQRMRSYLMWDRDPGTSQAVDWVTGAFIIVTKPCMDALGKHDDDRFFLFMSDVAICREAWNKGFEVHIVGQVECLHNDERLSSGGIKDVFRKRIIRLHIKDSISYFWHYKFAKIPADAPSISNVKAKERLLTARKLAGVSTLKAVDKKLQRQNPVVTVYQGQIDGKSPYKQPIVFFDTGVIGVVLNSKGEYGLIKIWRHTPLQFDKNNTFPIFPDVGNLGIWSLETVRGGVEKGDANPEQSLRRELQEEMGVEERHIKRITRLGSVIGNTAIDVYRHIVFLAEVREDFHFKPKTGIETIQEVNFYSPAQIRDLIASEQLSCGLTQAAILQAEGRN
jgi:N-acetylglucosaminyl-diphospho-decaprenol L-rhamnosyltransferase